MLIQHNLNNIIKKSQGYGERHGVIYASFDIPFSGIKTYEWDVYGDTIEEIRSHTRDVKSWAAMKANNLGDVPYRVEVV